MATKSSNRIDIGINERDRKKIAEGLSRLQNFLGGTE